MNGAPPATVEAVLDWYAASGRDLAFRRTSDPWAILVSEVMAQQTRAARAAEAWARFMAAYPTPASLADASPAAVIRSWRGLGYNRRALALRGAATAIVREHEGRVPDTLEALVRLPGVGPYTARAVLAIAFGRPIAALDVNIRRVVGRAFAGGEEKLPPRGLQALADRLVPEGAAAAWTHALMDIGAAFCRPREPRCDECPLRAACSYRGQRPAAGPPAGRKGPGSLAPAIRFEATSRWLRGRILDHLRDAPDMTWLDFDLPLGDHDLGAVSRALAALAGEGLLELQADQPRRARLATSP